MSDFKELSRSVKGLTVLVTGAASGMGQATARVFAAEGANVAVTDVSAEGTQAVADEITANGGKARAWTLDVANRDDIVSVVNDVAAHFGGLDIIVNNAGISVRVAIDDEAYEDAWAKAIAVMLTAHPRIIRAALPHLRKSKSPRIVNIASTEALGATALHSPYSAAKGGVAGLTRSLAPGCGQLGIRVNAICPGYVDTPMNALIFGSDVFRDAFARDHATGLQTPEEIAALVVFLASDEASSLTGAVLSCDRGWTAFKRPAAIAG